jgi:beta-phosphoglucomutase
MPRYQAVLFDFDGVLLDSEPVHFACWREVLAPLGVPLDWQTYRDHCIGVADLAMLDFLRKQVNPPVPLERLWDEYPRKKELFRKRMVSEPSILPETRELIRELNGYRLAVVSSSGRSEVEPILIAAGIRPAFGAVVCGEDVKHYKPDPEPYLLAARLLGVTSALVVEDSGPGVESGRAAGFDVIEVEGPARVPELIRAKA